MERFEQKVMEFYDSTDWDINEALTSDFSEGWEIQLISAYAAPTTPDHGATVTTGVYMVLRRPIQPTPEEQA